MLPGFDYTAESGTFFEARIDPYLLVPTSYDEPTIPWSENLDVGTIPGVAGVNNGAATYNIPIEVPSGSAGIAPSLAITYNSLSADGLLGDKWNVSGFSLISRVPEAEYYDSGTDPVDFDNNDQFAIDGQRLIKLSSGVYTTEIETYSRIYPLGTSDNGPQKFKVVASDGTEMYYGYKKYSRIETTKAGNESVNFWLLDSIVDVHGNYTSVSYIERDGNFYPKKVKYAGNINTNTTPCYSIELYYTKKQDLSFAYIGGGKITNDLIVRKIQVAYKNEKLRTYQFKYSFISNKSKLKEIVLYNQYGDYLNSTKIDWGEYSDESQTGSLGIHCPFTVDRPMYPGDFNNTGKTNFLEVWTDDIGVKTYSLISTNGTRVMDDKLFQDDDGVDDYDNIYIGDFNGDGFDDILQVRDTWQVINRKYEFRLVFNGITVHGHYWDDKDLGNFTTNETYKIKFYFGDINGDNQTDIIAKRKNDIDIYTITGSNTNTGCTYTISKIGTKSDVEKDDYLLIEDLNGDKRDEITIKNYKTYEIKTFTLLENEEYLTLLYSEILDSANLVKIADFNGDGLSDFLLIKNQTGNSHYYVRFSGGPVMTSKEYPISTPNLIDPPKIADFNGDGKADIAFVTTPNPEPLGYHTIKINSLCGDEFVETNHETYGFVIFNDYEDYVHNRIIDGNGDGKADIIGFNREDGNLSFFSVNINDKSDRVEKITDGFKKEFSFEYKPLTDLNVYSQTLVHDGWTAFGLYNKKLRVIMNPLYVVSKFEYPAGVENEYDYTSYLYEDAIVHLQGKGFLGFLKTTEIKRFDANQTRFFTISEKLLNKDYYLLYPEKNTFKTDNRETNEVITLSETTYSPLEIVPCHNSDIVFRTEMEETTETNYLNGTSVTTSFVYDNTGKITQSTSNNGVYNTIKDIVYDEIGPGSYNYKVISEAITQTRAGNTDNHTTTSHFEYYESTGELKKEISKPYSADFRVETEYFYDSFGNPDKMILSPINKQPRIAHVEYDPTGRYVEKSIDPMGFETTYTYDEKTGSILSETSINGLTTKYEYDNWNVPTRTIYPDGNSVSNIVTWNSNGLYKSTTTNIDGTIESTVYDILERPIFYSTVGFDGRPLYASDFYNAKGQLIKKYEAHYPDEVPIITNYTYDYYGRTKSVSTDFSLTTYDYGDLGSKTVSVTSDGKTKTTTVNDAGEVIESTDNGGTIFYDYYATGLTKDVIYNDNTVSFEYDKHGNKTQIKDPDAGEINYEYDALNNLVKQTDNGEYVFEMEYDILNRLIQKTGPEGTTTYEYDSQENGLGQLAKVTGFNGIYKSFFYDNLGRIYKTTENVDGDDYTYSYTFDNLNRIKTIQYPGGFKISKNYDNFGYLTEIKNAANNQLIWKMDDMNEFGQITKTTFGNGLSTNYVFDEVNKSLTNINTTGVQQQSYLFDEQTGNLMTRNLNSNEDVFTYDNLDRLRTSTGYSNLNVQYGPNGNIQHKSDLGEYRYNSNRPHAVTDINNSPENPSNQTITYTSFNKVNTIEETVPLNKGGSGDFSEDTYRLEFTYNSSHERKKTELYQNDKLIKTKYFFGAYEKEITDEGTRELNYITSPDGVVAIFEHHSEGTNRHSERSEESLYFIHKDHLGSITEITNQAGQLVQRFYYDPWGKRELVYDATGTDEPLFDRGYTGHQHLNIVTSNGSEMSLINMNARLYDPQLGRMLSPDNYIPLPDFTQAYNRYSYVYNNPLKYTDPDGNIPNPFFTTQFYTFFMQAVVPTVVASYATGVVSSGGNPFFWQWEGKDWAWAVGTGTVVFSSIVYAHMGRSIKTFLTKAKKSWNTTVRWTSIKHAIGTDLGWKGGSGVIRSDLKVFTHHYFFRGGPAWGEASGGATATIFRRAIPTSAFNSRANGNLGRNFGNYTNVDLISANGYMDYKGSLSYPRGAGYNFQFNGGSLPTSGWSWRGRIPQTLTSINTVFFQLVSTPTSSVKPEGPLFYTLRIEASGSTGRNYPTTYLSGTRASNIDEPNATVPWRPWGQFSSSCPPWKGGKLTWTKFQRENLTNAGRSLGFFRVYN